VFQASSLVPAQLSRLRAARGRRSRPARSRYGRVVGAGESEQAQPGAVAHQPAVFTVLHDDHVGGGFDDPPQAFLAFPAGQAHPLVDQFLLLLGDDLPQEGDVAAFQAGHDVVFREHAHKAVAAGHEQVADAALLHGLGRRPYRCRALDTDGVVGHHLGQGDVADPHIA
jgi:hypothetical protein